MISSTIAPSPPLNGATAYQGLWCTPLIHTKGPRMPIRIDRLAARGGLFDVGEKAARSFESSGRVEG